MHKSICSVFICSLLAHPLLAQSLLDGTTFQVSTYNMPDSVGVVRLVAADGNCSSEERSPVGDDLAPEGECAVFDSGNPAVELTFNAGPLEVGALTITPTATRFEGLDEESLVKLNNQTREDITDAPLPTWTASGDLIEFAMTTSNGGPPWDDDLDFFGFAANGIQYPGADPAAEIGMPYDEDFGGIGNYVNSYFWIEKSGEPFNDYSIGLPTGIGWGRHPLDPDRNVVYTLLSRNQLDQASDTVAGGSFDYFSHGSILSPDPSQGNLENLSFAVGIDDTENVTGWGLGILVLPPEVDGPSCEGVAATRLAGDADGDGTVAFLDFLALANNFGQSGVGFEGGDFDCDGTVAFLDFLALANNFGASASAVSAVPEPSGLVLLAAAFSFAGITRRRRK